MAHHGKKPAKMHKPMDGHSKPMKYKPMDGHSKKPAKINAAVGLHGPFKMHPGKHSDVNPGNFKGSEVAKYSAMKMHPMKYDEPKMYDKPASAGLKKLAAANPDKLKYIGPEKYGPEKYHGPNMYDKPMFATAAEDYTSLDSKKKKEEESNGESNGGAKKENGEKKLSPGAEALKKARSRKKEARMNLKADRLNRRAERMELRRR